MPWDSHTDAIKSKHSRLFKRPAGHWFMDKTNCMRKIILLAIAVTLCCNAIYSQKEKKSWFGVKGGFNHTVINGVETNGSKTGFVGSTLYGGLFTENHIGATTLLMNELLFSWVNDWHFIEATVHLKQMLNERTSVFLGSKLDFAADHFDSRKQSKSGFAGVSLETGAQFSFTKRLFAEGRYSIGLSRQFRDPFFDINDGRRNNLRFGVGFRF